MLSIKLNPYMHQAQAISPSTRIMNAGWRAAAYCFHPRVIGLSFLPLLLSMVVFGVLGWFFWQDAVNHLSQGLNHWAWSRWMLDGLANMDLNVKATWIAGFVLLLFAVPAVVVICLLLVAFAMTPALVRLVAQRRFAALALLGKDSLLASISWSLAATVPAIFALLISLPLWFVPPLGLILPPLIWGWLTYRVMSFDVLVAHATAQERKTLLKTHRLPLLVMGVVSGFLGAAPTTLWALGVMTLALLPIVAVASIWVYTLVFAFASLWFAHYLLQALHDLRQVAHAEPKPGDVMLQDPVVMPEALLPPPPPSM